MISIQFYSSAETSTSIKKAASGNIPEKAAFYSN